ncbi:MAG: CDP-diacylglycerol--glycerol-3-phosphate 3-phosphatidyltransferase [Clostridia bacterium]|nr:CDP-diacylglycerol--glycerol-3-phosphate 3-phosphatidyltransferase [Clostridia bacterium]
MNTANKLTILRVVLVPVFLAFMMMDGFAWQMAALITFIIASLTDMLDGQIARKCNQITTFGKFADPLADKMLITAAFLGFMAQGVINVWAVMIMLVREFMVSGVRLAAVSEGEVIAASFWGKFKTVSQMVAVIAAFLVLNIPAVPETAAYIITNVFVWISVVLTVLSGIDYLVNNWELMKLK